MKCIYCGSELIDGVKFCKECGQRVGAIKRFCRECGSELDEAAKFCKNCGATVNLLGDTPGPISISNVTERKMVTVTVANTGQNNAGKIGSTWAGKSPMNNRSNNFFSSKTFRLVILLTALFLCCIIVISAFIKNKEDKETSDTLISPIKSIATENTSEAFIDISNTYAYMSDDWDVYIAVPVSSKVIKIEHWKKTISSTKKMSYDEDIGTYKIDDENNGFYCIDDEHTAFAFIIVDKNNSRISKGKHVIFTINISDTNICKGSDYDESIACYSYTNDDWHEYRAIQLTDKLIKIEVWSRTSSLDKLLFGYDMCLINPNSDETDFEWNDSHTAFTITIKDPENDYNWKTASFVAFTLLNPDFKYATVMDYLTK